MICAPFRPPARPVAITGSPRLLNTRATLMPLPPAIDQALLRAVAVAQLEVRRPSASYRPPRLTVTVRIIEVPGSRAGKGMTADAPHCHTPSQESTLDRSGRTPVQLKQCLVAGSLCRDGHRHARGGYRGLVALGHGALWLAGDAGGRHWLTATTGVVPPARRAPTWSGSRWGRAAVAMLRSQRRRAADGGGCGGLRWRGWCATASGSSRFAADQTPWQRPGELRRSRAHRLLPVAAALAPGVDHRASGDHQPARRMSWQTRPRDRRGLPPWAPTPGSSSGAAGISSRARTTASGWVAPTTAPTADSPGHRCTAGPTRRSGAACAPTRGRPSASSQLLEVGRARV